MATTTPKKIVLITGCSTGSIGSALAKEFHRRGWHVIATARSLTRLQELKSLGVQVEELDVTEPTSIQALRVKITSLDLLFNNAGYIPISSFHVLLTLLTVLAYWPRE